MTSLGTSELRAALSGKKLALMMNHSALDNDGRCLIDVIASDWGCDVRCLFSMEHGLRGNMTSGFMALDGSDEKTGVPVECLYKYPEHRPPVELLREVDAAVFSAQDAGSRCYTYAPWMCYLLDAAAKAGCEVIVLDRPNPIGGDAVEGGLIEPSQFGLLGTFPYPMRHGLTIGELASMYNDTMHVGARLRIVRMEGYDRGMYYADTRLPWTPVSPNIPTPETFLPFAGMVLFENLDINHGRGTTAPFYYAGAPFIDGERLARRMNALRLPGVRCLEAVWQPQSAAYANEICRGVFFNVTEPRVFRPVDFAVRLIFAIYEEYSGRIRLNEPYMHTESGSALLYRTLVSHGSPDTVLSAWREDAEVFSALRRPWLLY